MDFDFVHVLIGVGVMVGLFGLTAALLYWRWELLESAEEPPAEPAQRALFVTRNAFVLALILTLPAIAAHRAATTYLPEAFHGTWWGALLVTYGGAWLILFAYLERKWRTTKPS